MAELENGMSAAEMAEWWQWYQEEPFGDVRADLRAGILASTVANTAAMRSEEHVFTPTEFMPFMDREEPSQESREKYLAIQSSHLDALVSAGLAKRV